MRGRGRRDVVPPVLPISRNDVPLMRTAANSGAAFSVQCCVVVVSSSPIDQIDMNGELTASRTAGGRSAGAALAPAAMRAVAISVTIEALMMR